MWAAPHPRQAMVQNDQRWLQLMFSSFTERRSKPLW
jgi:hypothetical protein